MRGADKCKVVTSGRLTGGVRAQLSRRRGTQDPGPVASPEPGYSLHSTSTDSGEQVSSLHKGLDQCAALLTDTLQAEKTEALPSLPRAVMGRAAKKTPCSSLRKKPISNTKTDQRGRKPDQPVPCTTTCPHAVKLHPPEKPTSIHPPEKQTPNHPPQTSIRPSNKHTPIHPPQTPNHPPQTSIRPSNKHTPIHPPQTPNHPPQTSIRPSNKHTPIHPPQTPIHPPQTPNHPPQTSIHPSNKHTSIHHPQTSIHPGRPQTSISYTDCKAECDKEEEEFVSVRDINVQSSAVRQTCTLKVSDMQLKLGPVDNVPQEPHSGGECSAETDVKVKTSVQYLLGELKTLIAGQGSAAERLLSHLEQTVSSPLMAAGSSNIRTEPELLSLHSQNTQLRRRVRILSQQLKQRGRAETHQNLEMLCNSEVFSLQEELSTAQAVLQELQEDLIGLRKALKDTQSRLTDKEAERALIQTDLEATRLRLLDSEREKSEMASLAQQRLEDIRNLKRILQCHDSFIRPPVVNRSVSDAEQRLNLYRLDPDEPPTDRINQFLMSLGQLQPPPTEHVCVSAEREQRTLRDTLAHPDVRPPAGDPDAPLDPSHGLQDVQSCVQERLSRWDVESVRSDGSTRSGSTFNTRSEAAFRDGLAALDASIASLQKTIQRDLGRRC